MTAMNAFARPDGAYLISDTGRFMSDGTIAGFGSKVAFSNRLKVMAGHSGLPGPNCHENVQCYLDIAETQSAALEFGSSKMAARPYMRPARDNALPKAERRLTKQVRKIILKRK